jgi:hypothetical protein
MADVASGVVRVKVLCGSCARLICRIVDTPRGMVYRPNVGPPGALATFDARTVFCLEHGVPNLHDGQIAGAAEHVARARADGKVHTFRVSVSHTWTSR